jgi:hypothetical protein
MNETSLYTPFFIVTINQTVTNQASVASITTLNQNAPLPGPGYAVLMPQIVT